MQLGPIGVADACDQPLATREQDGEAAAQHALQTAHLAEQSGAGDELVTACLLHDLGHLLNDQGETPSLRGIDDTTPDKDLYPEYDDLLKFSSVLETQASFKKILDKNLSVREFVSGGAACAFPAISPSSASTTSASRSAPTRR